MRRERISPWQILFYLSMAVLTLWLILKLTGVIQTPPLLEYGVPILSVILGFLSQNQQMTNQYNNLVEKINDVSVSLARVATKIEHVDRDVEYLKKRA